MVHKPETKNRTPVLLIRISIYSQHNLFGLLGGSSLSSGLGSDLLRLQDSAGAAEGSLGEVLAVLHAGQLLLQLAQRTTGSRLEVDLGDVLGRLVHITGLLVDQCESLLVGGHNADALPVHQTTVPVRADIHQVSGLLKWAKQRSGSGREGQRDTNSGLLIEMSLQTYRAEGLGDVGLLNLEGIPLAHDQPVQVGRRSSHFNLESSEN